MNTAFLVQLSFAVALALSLRSAWSAEAATSSSGHFKQEARPNFVFFLVDDLGWADNSISGNKCYETPNLSKLVSEGMVFTSAYSAAALCSPTRASIMTGKSPARLHLTYVLGPVDAQGRKLIPPDWTKYLPLEETTLAEALRASGYATGSFGKWHLEGARGFGPDAQGFDTTTFWRHVTTHFSPYYSTPPYPESPSGQYLADRLTEDAISFITNNQHQPFFAFISHYAVHVSANGKLEAKPDYVAKYERKPACAAANPAYASVVQSVDESLGRILATLQRLKIDERTVIIFTSDNGGWEGATSNKPLRGGKASAYEGGIRVPLVVKWPLVVHGGTVCSVPVTSADFYPTMLTIARAPLQPKQHVDGQSLIPLLKQSGNIERESLFWHFPHYHAHVTPWGAVRNGNWKLIEYFENQGSDRYSLYDLSSDTGEKVDLSEVRPAIRDKLISLLAAWRHEVGAQVPVSNTEYDQPSTKS